MDNTICYTLEVAGIKLPVLGLFPLILLHFTAIDCILNYIKIYQDSQFYFK